MLEKLLDNLGTASVDQTNLLKLNLLDRDWTIEPALQ
jgi:hypothetical protein